MILRVFQILFLVLAPFVVPAELVPPQMLASRQTVDATVVKVLPDLRSEVNYRGAIEVLAPEGELPKWELFSFDGAQVQLLEFRAWVVNKGQKTEVPSSSIQRTPVSDPGGLSKDIKVEVAFPRLKVGSRIEWTYRTLERSPPVHGFFSCFRYWIRTTTRPRDSLWTLIPPRPCNIGCMIPAKRSRSKRTAIVFLCD